MTAAQLPLVAAPCGELGWDQPPDVPVPRRHGEPAWRRRIYGRPVTDLPDITHYRNRRTP